jgi:GAF domain-containing protein
MSRLPGRQPPSAWAGPSYARRPARRMVGLLVPGPFWSGIGVEPTRLVGLLGLIGTQGHPLAWPVDRVRQFGDRSKGTRMPIDPAMLAKSIGSLNDLDPTRDLVATLQQAVLAAKQLFDAQAAGIMLADADGQLRWASASDQRAQTLEDNQEIFAAGPCSQAYATGRPAVMHDATLERRWGEITLTFVEVQIRSGLSVPVELGGGPIGTLDVYTVDARGWDDTEVSALQAYAGVVASLLGAAAKAELKDTLADQLQTALDSRVLIEQAKGALMERERLDEQEAFTHLRRAARSSGRRLVDVAREVSAGRPLPRGGGRLTG